MGELFQNSGVLFARPSFLEGVSRLYDLGGTWNYYNVSPNGKIADYYALYHDWKSVGDSISYSITAVNSPPKLVSRQK